MRRLCIYIFILLSLSSCNKENLSVQRAIGLYEVNETWVESGQVKSRIYILDVRPSKDENRVLFLNFAGYGGNSVISVDLTSNEFDIVLQPIGGGISVNGNGNFGDNSLNIQYFENTNTGDAFRVTLTGSKK